MWKIYGKYMESISIYWNIWLHVLAIVSGAAVNTGVHVSFPFQKLY